MTSFFPPQVSSNAASVPTYANFASLPITGTQGDLAITLDTNTLYEYTGTAWGAVGTAGSTIVAVADTAKIDLTNTAGTLSATVVAGSLNNTDVATGAGIAVNKLAAVTASRALTSDASGYVSASSVTSTELGYVSGVSSAIQTQINSKASSASPTFTGTITVPVGPGVMKASVIGSVSASSIVDSDVSASAAIAVTKIANGTANQLVGANAAGSANEFKSLSVGTTGSDFAIVNSVGGIAFNLPDAGASTRGVVSTGTQTLAGAKTFSQITTVSNTTVSNSPTTGALLVSGGVGIAGQVTSGSLQVGTVGSAAGAITVNDSAGGAATVDNYGPTPTGNYGSTAFTFRYSDGGGAATALTITPTTTTVSSALKLSTGTGILHSSSVGAITSSNIVNADVDSAAAIAVTKLANGTANQLLGTNSGATGNEFKTLSVGTTGTDFAIAHSAGGVAFNLPDASASARGVVTTGTQTLAGAKTLSGITTVSNATASTTAGTGALVVTGGTGIGGALNVTSYGKFSDSVIIAGAATNPAAGQGSIGVAGASLYISQLGTTSGASHNGVINLTAYDSAIANGKSLVITSGGVTVTATTAATTKSSGALVVSGGVGIGGAAVVNSIAAIGAGTAGNTTGNHPYLACKIITGTTNASQGAGVTVAHGLTGSTIVAYSGIVDYSGNGDSVPLGFTGAGYQSTCNVNITNVAVDNVSGSSASILSKTFKILIWYTA